MITTWFQSQLLLNIQETNPNATIYDCFMDNDQRKSYIADFLNLRITKSNFKHIIELCDFLMVDDDVDCLIDEIIKIHDYDYSIIYEFEDFYKQNTKRIRPLSRHELHEAIEYYNTDVNICFQEYGFSSFWNTSEITDMSYMFCEDLLFNGDISRWDMSNVTNMNAMFYGSAFNGNISQWDVSNVNYMANLFSRSVFNGDISDWNVSNVVNMTCMFYESYFQNDISRWNVSNVITMSFMFTGSVFNNDISNWDISSVKSMEFMFSGSLFDGDVSNWDVSSVENMNSIFYECEFSGDISKWNPINTTILNNNFDEIVYGCENDSEIPEPNMEYL